MTRNQYEHQAKFYPNPVSITDYVQTAVNELLDSLYIHTLERPHCRDAMRIKYYGIDDNEPINWGDLKCCEVVEVLDEEYQFIITIDEASPNECPTLCEFIRKHMQAYGWNVIVKTEW